MTRGGGSLLYLVSEDQSRLIPTRCGQDHDEQVLERFVIVSPTCR